MVCLLPIEERRSAQDRINCDGEVYESRTVLFGDGEVRDEARETLDEPDLTEGGDQIDKPRDYGGCELPEEGSKTESSE